MTWQDWMGMARVYRAGAASYTQRHGHSDAEALEAQAVMCETIAAERVAQERTARSEH